MVCELLTGGAQQFLSGLPWPSKRETTRAMWVNSINKNQEGKSGQRKDSRTQAVHCI
jgi:hypothetical protein